MTMFLNVILVIFFVFMNAFFVVSEFAMVKIRKSQIDMLTADRGFGAKYAKLVTDNLNAYLSACQLGITLASLALGWIGEPAVSAMIKPLLVQFGLSDASIYGISVALGFAIITALHIVLGELVPKSLAIFSTERYALLTAPALVFFYRMTYPVMWLFNTLTNGIVKLMGHSMEDENTAYSDEELKLLMDESRKSGLFEPEKYAYVDNIFEMDDKDAKKIMTPRTDMVCLYLEDTFGEDIKTISETRFTRYPVCDEDKDNIVGFVHIKDLYALQSAENPDIRNIMREIQVVHESIPVGKLIHVFREEKTKLAIVVDEHGGTSGIVTLSDVFSEIIGDIEDEYAHEEDNDWVEMEENCYQVDASEEVEELTERFGIEIDEDIDCETIGGFLLELVGEFPEEGEEIRFENLLFTIKKIDSNKIDTVEIRVLEKNETEGGTEK